MNNTGQIGLFGVLALFVAAPSADAGLTVTFETSPTPGGAAAYAPNNVVAAWVEDSDGAFVRTIGGWAGGWGVRLVAWKAASADAGIDALSGATQPNHDTAHTLSWDFLAEDGTVAADGAYTLRLELADQNAAGPGDNHQGTFSFTKGEVAEEQGPLAGNGFANVTLDAQPGDPLPVISDGNVVTGGCATGSGRSGALALCLLLAAWGMSRASIGRTQRRQSRH